MEAFAKFIESEAFFPVLILLLVMLLLVFIWVLMSGKNEEKKRRNKLKRAVDESAEIKIVQEDIVNVSVEDLMKATENNLSESTVDPKIEENNNVDNNLENNIIKENIENVQNVQCEVELPKIDLPINQMDETPVTVNKEKNIQEDKEEMVELPKEEIIPPEEIASNEIIDVPRMEEYKEIEVGEQVEVPVEQTSSNEIVNDEIAFNSTPTEEKEINENIQINEPDEYLGEKTEIFDFPDFDSIEENGSKDIEDDIIDAANKYIESIMKR